MNIVIIGVWWSWISSLAFLFQELWLKNIVWINDVENDITNKLKEIGINMIMWHWNYIPNEDDFVIYSDAAIDCIELKKYNSYKNDSKKDFHKPFSYFEFLWEISKYFKTIAIWWSHWKSSTTAVAIDIMSKVDSDFGLWILWALVPSFDWKNYLINKRITSKIRSIFQHIFDWNYAELDIETLKKYYFLVEADEFNRHFLLLDVDYALITNIELDHSDVYNDFYTYLNIFKSFIYRTRYRVFLLEWENSTQTLKEVFHKKIKIAKNRTFNMKNLFWNHYNDNLSVLFDLLIHVNPKIDLDKIRKLIDSFEGISRRMEYLWELSNWAKIYSDYWHHPTELKAVYRSAREKFKDTKLVSIFQPHQARRAVEFFDEFVDILNMFDESYIYDIYTARENFKEIQKNIIWTDDIELTQLKNLNELWELMSNKVWNKYLKTVKDIDFELQKFDENTIVIFFSAWDLDYLIRNNIDLKL